MRFTIGRFLSLFMAEDQKRGEKKFYCKRNHIRKKEKLQLLLKDATGKKRKGKKNKIKREKYFVLPDFF